MCSLSSCTPVWLLWPQALGGLGQVATVASLCGQLFKNFFINANQIAGAMEARARLLRPAFIYCLVYPRYEIALPVYTFLCTLPLPFPPGEGL